MTINDSSLAAGVGISANNTPFTSAALNVPRKVLVVASVLAANEGNFTENTPEIVTSVQYHANKAGRGSAAAKVLEWVREHYDGELWLAPTFEDSWTQSAGSQVFAGTCTAAGPLHMYVGGHKIKNINIEVDDDGENVQEKVVLAVTADPDLPFSAVENGSTPEQVDLTAKSGGTWGDFQIDFNLGFGEELPAGITLGTTTDMTGGAGIVTLQDVLDELGIDDDQNENFFTAIIHCNGQDTTSLDALSTWNGAGNTVTGNWGKLVHKPLRSMVADTVAGSSGLSSLITLGGNRKETDRTSGCVAVPGSPNCPVEIAAKTVAIMEQVASLRPHQGYVGQVLSGVWPGAVADRWTSSYDSRDTATKAGITATTVKGGSVKLSNVITFYHSAAVTIASNGYREMVDIAKMQNMLYSHASEFEQESWQGFAIVEDISMVTSAIDRQACKSVENVRSTLNKLADSFAQKGWLYNSTFTKEKLKESGYITIRGTSDGFNVVFPCILSGKGNIIDLQIAFDTNVAAA